MEFNIDIVKGYYQPTTEPQYACFATEHPGVLANDLDKLFNIIDHPDQEMFMAQSAFFVTNHRANIVHGVKVNLNFVEESDIIATREEIGNTDVGYIYLRDTIDNLKKAPHNGLIYLRLLTPREKVLCLMINPQMIADVLEAQLGEIADKYRKVLTPSPSTMVRHLISVPHPVDPGMILTVPYFNSSCLATVTYHNSYGIPEYKCAGNIYVRETSEEVETCE